MRMYVVRPGDSPASIAAAYAGCPKCARDLVAAHPHKPTVTLPNGYTTFKTLRAGEVLNLPDKWFTKEFDELPPSYFAALPHPSGGLLGAAFSAALVGAAQAAASAMASDPNYCASVRQPGSGVNSAVHSFKAAWNTSQSPAVPINTGNYEMPVAAALAQVLGGAPIACDAPQPAAMAAAAVPKARLSTGAVVGIGLAVAGAVGGATYFATRRRPARRAYA
jgi:hypothetical protein